MFIILNFGSLPLLNSTRARISNLSGQMVRQVFWGLDAYPDEGLSGTMSDLWREWLGPVEVPPHLAVILPERTDWAFRLGQLFPSALPLRFHVDKIFLGDREWKSESPTNTSEPPPTATR